MILWFKPHELPNKSTHVRIEPDKAIYFYHLQISVDKVFLLKMIDIYHVHAIYSWLQALDLLFIFIYIYIIKVSVYVVKKFSI